MVPPEIKSQLSKLKVKVEENILKVKVIEEHIEKVQNLQICDQHDNKASTLPSEITKEVGLKNCEKFVYWCKGL